MSYQVLARKWRPRIFREMVGQEHVLKALINALDHNRLHHAYLFTGTRGVGKTTIARILAKCLNCETGVSSEPCGTCSACTEISEGRFVDLIEVDAASRTRVEDTRELLDNVQYAPTRGRYKVYLIDEVHMLSSHSFNALLKTLEEPPEHVKFLLATTDPQKLPITILSRCLQFNLKNMTPERIVAHLTHVLGEEMVPFEESALWLLARSADGSMRDALSLTDQAIGFGSGKISDADVSAMLGTIDHKLIERLMGALISCDAQTVLNAVAEFSEHAPDYHAALGDLIGLLHRLAIAQVVPEAIDNSVGDKDQVLRFASELAPEDVQLFYQTALVGRRDLHLSPEARSGFEMTLLRMLAFKPQGVANVPSRPLPVTNDAPQAAAPVGASSQPSTATTTPEPTVAESLNSAPTEGPAPVKKPEPESAPQGGRRAILDELDATASTNKPSVAALQAAVDAVAPPKPAPASQPSSTRETQQPATAVDDEPTPEAAPVFKKFVGSLDSLTPEDWIPLYVALGVRGVLQSTVANCVLVGKEGNQLMFWLDEGKASLFDDSHQQRLGDLLSDYFEQPVKAFIELKTLGDALESPAQCYARRLAQAKHNAVQTLHSDPVVQALQSEFGAVLNEDSVKFDKTNLM